MGKDILENILEEIVGNKGKILLGLWRYKERISESGIGNWWRKTKRRKKRKREKEGEERERERGKGRKIDCSFSDLRCSEDWSSSGRELKSVYSTRATL